MKVKKGYDFDDLLLEPQVSTINSRTFVDLSVDLNGLKLNIPIIASPMKGIISEDMIIWLSKMGGIGIQHRFFSNKEELLKSLSRISRYCNNWGVAVGIDDTYMDVLSYNPSMLCIDVANGNLDGLRYYVDKVKKSIMLDYGNTTLLMTGNVATYKSAKLLADSGVDLIRVGIGNGTLCTTRNITGVGIPQLTALDNCRNVEAFIVCDGGIKNSGDAVKALAAGADLIMMGTPFAQTFDSANNGIIYGMASRKLQEEYYHSVKSVEGLEKSVEKKISLGEFISDFTWGMKSAFTYLNARNIKELQKNATWVEAGIGSIKKL